MTPTGLDVTRETSEGVWVYHPVQHKTTWRNRKRLIVLGPKSVTILKPRLPVDLEAPLFPSPKGIYSTTSYRTAVQRAAKRAGVDHWHPHQIRHSKATLVESEYGREAAANAIGDSIETTAIYAEVALRKMIDIAKRMG